jgi:hypothetical protein
MNANSTIINPWQAWERESKALRKRVVALINTLLDISSSQDESALVGSPILLSERQQWQPVIERWGSESAGCLAKCNNLYPAEADTFIDKLRKDLSDRGHHVLGEGMMIIVDKVVHVQLDLTGSEAHINDSILKHLDRRTIVAAIEQSAKALGDAAQPDKFIQELFSAYKLVIASTGRTLGSQIETTSILPYLLLGRQKSRFLSNPTLRDFVEYPAPTFRADLLALMSAEDQTIDGYNFRHASGSDMRGAVFMFVPSLGRPAHVGRIWFEPHSN